MQAHSCRTPLIEGSTRPQRSWGDSVRGAALPGGMEDRLSDRITDPSLAERTVGKVESTTGEVTLLVPQGKANRALLVNFPNRGNRTATRLFNRAPLELVPTDEIDPGDGFLMRHGWTVAFCGWQWDAPKPGPRMGITPPQVPPRMRNPDGNMHLRIQPNEVTAAYRLTDHHVGSIGQHRPIP